MYKRITLLLLVTFLTKIIFSQIEQGDLSVIHFLNGDTLEISVVDQNKWITTVLKPTKNKSKFKYKPYNNDQILSIINSDNEKKIMYKYDPSVGNFMEKEEMEQYVKGRTKAKYYYTAKTPFFVSFLFGITIGLIDTYNFADPKFDKGFLNHPAGLISLSTPFLSASIFGNNRISFSDRKNKSDEELLNESFVHGYAKEKKSKISRSTSCGSLLGVLSVILIQINKQ